VVHLEIESDQGTYSLVKDGEAVLECGGVGGAEDGGRAVQRAGVEEVLDEGWVLVGRRVEREMNC
jgi:hypothetical protein